jgi:outer membrane protein assembly factor BamB
MNRLPLALALAAPLLLVGCGSWNPLTWFGPDKPKPAALETFSPKLNVAPAWSQRLDSVQFPLGMAVRRDTLVAAGSDGTVVAFNAADGRELWRGQAGSKLSAGVGSDGRFAAVVTRDNELVVLDAGKPAWHERLNSRAVTPTAWWPATPATA